MNSEYHIDTPKHADYPLPAGLHCQSVLAGRGTDYIRFIPSEGEVCLYSTRLPHVAVGREGDTFGCAGSVPSLLTPFRSATIF